VVMKSSIFWDITPCSSSKINRRYRRICLLHLLSLLATCFTLVSCLAYSWTLKMEVIVPPKCRLTFNELHGVISRNI
jgi:hypothetical protein